MIREIVTIDEDLCDGCALCIPECHEGALQIVQGKARLVADRLCDGLGACLGHCPRGAIKVDRREAAAFDEQLAAASRGTAPHAPENARPPVPPHAQPVGPSPSPAPAGCPGSRLAQFAACPPPVDPPDAAQASAGSAQPSQLTHWPVQLRLLGPHAPVLQGASLLVAADCVPVAYADFQTHLLRGRTVVIGCPKFDDLAAYVEKLTEMIRANDLREILVARMEVPCCAGLLRAVLEARRLAGSAVPVTSLVLGIRGQPLGSETLPAESDATRGSSVNVRNECQR
jgi:NAD-dependent dihydropyrimidine dehydrogenase PreA subunit